MSRNPPWYDILLEAAQLRRIELPNLDLATWEVKHVLEIAAWVNQNLKDNTPLSSEEFAIWQFINKPKGQPRIVDDQGGPVSVPLDEEAVRDAIHSLELETRNLQNKSRILEDSNRFMTEFYNKDDSSRQRQDSFQATITRRNGAQKQHTLLMKNEIESELQQQIRLAQEKLEKGLRAVDSTVKEKLKADDRVLEFLDPSAPSKTLENAVQRSNSQSMLDALQRATVQSLKARLDRVYLSEVEARNLDDEGRLSSDQLQQTKDSLQSLYTEIEDIASMLTDKEHGTRLRAMEEKLASLEDENAARHALQVTSRLEALTRSVDQLATRYQLLQAHRIACDRISNLFSHSRSQTNLLIQRNEKEDLKHGGPKLLALLRHVNIDPSEAVKGMDITQEMHKLSTSLTDRNQSVTDRIVADAQRAANLSQEQLQRLLATSNDDFSGAMQQNKQLDDRMALVKTRLEMIASNLDTNVDVRRKFISSSMHASG